MSESVAAWLIVGRLIFGSHLSKDGVLGYLHADLSLLGLMELLRFSVGTFFSFLDRYSLMDFGSLVFFSIVVLLGK